MCVLSHRQLVVTVYTSAPTTLPTLSLVKLSTYIIVLVELFGVVLCCEDVDVLQNGVESVDQARDQLRSAWIEYIS